MTTLMQWSNIGRMIPFGILFDFTIAPVWTMQQPRSTVMEETVKLTSPETKLSVIKRYLHILALIQNPRDPQDWNMSTLADCLSHDEPGEPMTEKKVRIGLFEKIQSELGIDVSTYKGGRRVSLDEDLDHSLLVELLLAYSDFVITDTQRRIVMDTLARTLPNECLWILARIRFASLMLNIITFTYTNNEARTSTVQMHPYHLVFRNNNLYLVGKRESDGRNCMYVLNRIRDLSVLDSRFNETVPGTDELFKNSLGSFISPDIVPVTIRFARNLSNTMHDVLAGLDAEYTESDDAIEARFAVSDTMALCKQLFLYGSAVEIVGPEEVRAEMVCMLEEAMSVYRKKGAKGCP
jgi:hypothetical protein